MNRQEWDKAHKSCPECKMTKISQTLVNVPEIDGHYHDELNTALCRNCGWNGKVSQLVPEPETAEPVNHATLRTIDHEENSYVCIKDFTATIENFNQNICSKLTDESVKTYTKSIMGEITSMLASLDMQHWANKHNTNNILPA